MILIDQDPYDNICSSANPSLKLTSFIEPEQKNTEIESSAKNNKQNLKTKFPALVLENSKHNQILIVEDYAFTTIAL